MKKLLVSVSCIAVILIASHVSFAQEGLVDPVAADVPCACSAAQIVPPPAPLAYPPYCPAPTRVFGIGYRRAARALPAVAPVGAPAGLPYPFSVADLKPRSVRRAARLAALAAAPPCPMPVPVPVAAPAPMVVGGAPPMIAPPDGSTAYGYGPIGQTGKRNISLQRSGTTGPVINFLSIVRTMPNPYVGYPAPVPVH